MLSAGTDRVLPRKNGISLFYSARQPLPAIIISVKWFFFCYARSTRLFFCFMQIWFCNSIAVIRWNVPPLIWLRAGVFFGDNPNPRFKKIEIFWVFGFFDFSTESYFRGFGLSPKKSFTRGHIKGYFHLATPILLQNQTCIKQKKKVDWPSI